MGQAGRSYACSKSIGEGVLNTPIIPSSGLGGGWVLIWLEQQTGDQHAVFNVCPAHNTMVGSNRNGAGGGKKGAEWRPATTPWRAMESSWTMVVRCAGCPHQAICSCFSCLDVLGMFVLFAWLTSSPVAPAIYENLCSFLQFIR